MAFTMCNQRQRLALELNVIPAGFAATLERRGLARQVEVTAAGIALEPVGAASRDPGGLSKRRFARALRRPPGARLPVLGACCPTGRDGLPAAER